MITLPFSNGSTSYRALKDVASRKVPPSAGTVIPAIRSSPHGVILALVISFGTRSARLISSWIRACVLGDCTYMFTATTIPKALMVSTPSVMRITLESRFTVNKLTLDCRIERANAFARS